MGLLSIVILSLAKNLKNAFEVDSELFRFAQYDIFRLETTLT